VGVGVDRTPTLLSVVVGLQERHVLVETVPRQLPRRGSVTLSGKLDAARYGDPHLIVTAPNGTVTDKGIPSKAGTFRGELVCTDDGRYQVEITATGKGGVAVLSNFPIYCGVPPPARAPGTAGMTPGQFLPGDAEKRMVDLLNRDRAAANLPALTLDRQLSDVARAHSAEMAEHDVVSHNSPRTGTTLDRVHHAGLNPELVSENVGRAYTAEQAETGFMASPGHRAPTSSTVR
jgi:hypothetical protein